MRNFLKVICISIVLFSICACGANQAYFVTKKHNPLGQSAYGSIAPILVSYDLFSAKPEDYFSKKNDVEKKLVECFDETLKAQNLPISIIPPDVLRVALSPGFDFNTIEDEEAFIRAEILKTQPAQRIQKFDLKYLAFIRLETEFNAPPNGTVGSATVETIPIWAIEKSGTKRSGGNATLVKLKTGESVSTSHFWSRGNEGVFAAILPIPFIWVWWADTEEEICEALPREIFSQLTTRKKD